MFYHEVIMKRDEEMEKRCTVMRDDMANQMRIEIGTETAWALLIGWAIGLILIAVAAQVYFFISDFIHDRKMRREIKRRKDGGIENYSCSEIPKGFNT